MVRNGEIRCHGNQGGLAVDKTWTVMEVGARLSSRSTKRIANEHVINLVLSVKSKGITV